MQNNRKIEKYLLAMAALVVLATTPATAAGEDRAPLGFHAGPFEDCLLYTSPSPRDQRGSRMPSSA